MIHLLRKQTVVFRYNFQQTANKQQRTYGVANCFPNAVSCFWIRPSFIFSEDTYKFIITSDAKEHTLVCYWLSAEDGW
jgi:hypothetical protein